jgi:hypothetical protein
MMQKSLAMGGGMVKPRVMTGNAMTPPPMEVMPPEVAPKMVMMDSLYRFMNSTKWLCRIQTLHLGSML